MSKQYFATYTGQIIQFCDDCPQFKTGKMGGWEITQCNDCERTDAQALAESEQAELKAPKDKE